MRHSHGRHSLSFLELARMFPDEASAEKWLVQERPTRKPQPYRCRDRRRDFSVKTDSLMHSSPLSCQTWVFAIFLFGTSGKGISSVQMAKMLGITQKLAWHLLHRLRENFSEFPEAFPYAVEIDETHVGGRFRSMHRSKRKENRLKLNYGKSIVVGVRDRATGRVSVLPWRPPGPVRVLFFFISLSMDRVNLTNSVILPPGPTSLATYRRVLPRRRSIDPTLVRNEGSPALGRPHTE